MNKAPAKYYKVPKPAVKIHRDGREVCNLDTKAGQDEYHRRKVLMLERQEHLCCICGEYLKKDQMTFEHEISRGGGKRDDRWEKDGKRLNGVAHFYCNSLKGSKRGTYNLDFIDCP